MKPLPRDAETRHYGEDVEKMRKKCRPPKNPPLLVNCLDRQTKRKTCCNWNKFSKKIQDGTSSYKFSRSASGRHIRHRLSVPYSDEKCPSEPSDYVDIKLPKDLEKTAKKYFFKRPMKDTITDQYLMNWPQFRSSDKKNNFGYVFSNKLGKVVKIL